MSNAYGKPKGFNFGYRTHNKSTHYIFIQEDRTIMAFMQCCPQK